MEYGDEGMEGKRRRARMMMMKKSWRGRKGWDGMGDGQVKGTEVSWWEREGSSDNAKGCCH